MPRVVIRQGANKGDVIPVSPAMKPMIFGRLLDCEYTIHDSLVSRKQFSLHFEGEAFVLTDLDSHNGTYHNGKKMSQPIPLHPGDRIACGSTLFTFDDDESDEEGKMTGKKVGGYRCIRRLGVGGMGEVYLAQQLTLGREVALKLLFADRMKDENQTQRFISEARNAGKLDHPNVIHVYEVGESEGIYYYSMELVSGGSVEDIIAGGKRLRPIEAVELLLEASSALDYAERKGIIHCDIKPANLMLTDDGHIRLADLGISKQTNEKGQADQNEGVYGSPHYMSPEQCRGDILDYRTDQYSLGIVAYRMISGRFPYDGTTARSIMEKHVFDALPPLETIVPHDVPALLCALVNRMLEKDPVKRFPSSRDLQDELLAAKRAIKTGNAPPSRNIRLIPDASVKKRGFRWFHIVIAVVIMVVLAVVWYMNSIENVNIIEEILNLFK